MRTILLICALLVAGCGDVRSGETAANEAAPNSASATQSGALPPAEPIPPGRPGGLPDDRTPLPEAPFTAQSAQGAANVIQTYFALVEEGKLAAARSLWWDPAAADSQASLRESYSEYHVQIGTPGRIEGAAGSSYVEIPIQPYGRLKTGQAFAAPSMATLSRVNDVPGSTAQQRLWHIRKIEMLPQPPGKGWPPGAKEIEFSRRRPGG